MSLFQGVSGKISIKEGTGSEKYLAHTTSWSVDSSMEVDSTAYFGGSETEEGFTEKAPGIIDWTASIEGAADFDESSGQDDVYEAHAESKLITVTLYLDENTGFRGQGYIDSYSASHDAGGKGEFSATVAGNGKLERFTV